MTLPAHECNIKFARLSTQGGGLPSEAGGDEQAHEGARNFIHAWLGVYRFFGINTRERTEQATLDFLIEQGLATDHQSAIEVLATLTKNEIGYIMSNKEEKGVFNLQINHYSPEERGYTARRWKYSCAKGEHATTVDWSLM